MFLSDEINRELNMTICACGCGEEIIPKRHHKWIPPKYKWGHNKASFKGGRVYNGDGYIKILKPEHPNCDNHGYVLEHRLVMEKHLGRYLEHNELVHHTNTIIDDNRIENLQVVTRGKHNGIHFKKDFSNRVCSICGKGKTIMENGYHHWRLNPITKKGITCNTCYYRLRNQFVRSRIA